MFTVAVMYGCALRESGVVGYPLWLSHTLTVEWDVATLCCGTKGSPGTEPMTYRDSAEGSSFNAALMNWLSELRIPLLL